MNEPDGMDRVWHYKNKNYFTSKQKNYNKFDISLEYFIVIQADYEKFIDILACNLVIVL